MKSFYIAAICIFLSICTPSMSMTFKEDLKDLGSELNKGFSGLSDLGSEMNDVLRSAYAAYKIADFLNQTAIKPSGQKCWICTLLMHTLETYVALNNITVDQFIMNDICPRVPLAYRPICQEIVNTYGPTVINILIETESADAACTGIGFCAFPECKLYQKHQTVNVTFSENWTQFFQIETPKLEAPAQEWLDRLYTRIMLETISHEDSKLAVLVGNLTTSGIDPLDWLKELINKIATNHSAIVDMDNDYFSQTSAELRGYNWRGRDCNDNDADVHPGRKTNPKPGFFDDFNCNGISGMDPTTNQDYEDELCGNSGQLGVVVMGDSAGAHCEVPTQWVNASQWDVYSFDDLIHSLADEIDLPHMSGYTGYADTGLTGPVSSFYKYMYQRNKCNFRDYQNIAVNGLNSRNAQGAIDRLGRTNDDFPVIVFLELIGNDVCGGEKTEDHWTTVDQFRTNLIGILDTLDTELPAGSHLVALGLVNGSLIFEGVNNRTHPAGITYNQLYDFQNCMNASLCWGWLNTNETIRQLTTDRAAQLSQVYGEVFSNYTAKNFDMAYYNFPADVIWSNWTAAGNDPYLLIEPVDGFHPSQIFHSMLGDYLWETLNKDHPDWLGSENPNNDRITQLFGDQGGY